MHAQSYKRTSAPIIRLSSAALLQGGTHTWSLDMSAPPHSLASWVATSESMPVCAAPSCWCASGQCRRAPRIAGLEAGLFLCWTTCMWSCAGSGQSSGILHTVSGAG